MKLGGSYSVDVTLFLIPFQDLVSLMALHLSMFTQNGCVMLGNSKPLPALYCGLLSIDMK